MVPVVSSLLHPIGQNLYFYSQAEPWSLSTIHQEIATNHQWLTKVLPLALLPLGGGGKEERRSGPQSHCEGRGSVYEHATRKRLGE